MKYGIVKVLFLSVIRFSVARYNTKLKLSTFLYSIPENIYLFIARIETLEKCMKYFQN